MHIFKGNAVPFTNLEIGRKILCLIDENMGPNATLGRLRLDSTTFLRRAMLTNNYIFESPFPFYKMGLHYF